MSISNFLENKLLDKTLRNTDFSITGVYVSIHNGDPGETGIYEMTTGAAVRGGITFGAASNGTGTSNVAVSITNMPSGVATYMGLWDASTSGNFLWGGALAASKVINQGDTFTFNSGNITVALD